MGRPLKIRVPEKWTVNTKSGVLTVDENGSPICRVFRQLDGSEQQVAILFSSSRELLDFCKEVESGVESNSILVSTDLKVKLRTVILKAEGMI